MAIAYDTAATKYQGTGTTNTQALTLSGSADYLVAFVMVVGSKTVSGVTWNGTAMTQIGSPVTANGGGFACYAFHLVAPDTGTHDLVSTISASGETYLGGIAYSGAAQTGQPDAVAVSNPSSSASSLVQSLTTIADNSWTACCMLGDQGGVSAGAGSTTRGSVLNTAWGIFDSNAAVTPAGSTSMTVNCTASTARTGIIISIAPFVAGGSPNYNVINFGAGI